MTTILAVEDNAEIVNMLRMVLERLGYKIIAAHNGEDALHLLEELPRRPDIILSNLFMPRMDGVTLLASIREHPDFYDIPFVMMSASPTPQHREAAFRQGADAFLDKPFRFEVLNSILQNLGVAAHA